MRVFLAAAVAVTACSTTPAMKIETDHKPEMAARLRSYQTFGVAPASTRQGTVDDVALGGLVVRSVDETLGSKGYRQEPTRPDFFVTWHVTTTTGQRPSPLEAPPFRDVGPLQSARASSVPVTTTRNEREGALTLEVIDAGSNSVVWRGSAQTALTGAADSRAREARIQDAGRRILDRFPPP